jgi:hypothetical protein
MGESVRGPDSFAEVLVAADAGPSQAEPERR